MIARLFVLLPFNLTVPDGQQFPVYQAEDSGYKIQFYPPGRSEKAPPLTDDEKITIDGVTAFQADVLQIAFTRKASIDDQRLPTTRLKLSLTEPSTSFSLASVMSHVPGRCDLLSFHS